MTIALEKMLANHCWDLCHTAVTSVVPALGVVPAHSELLVGLPPEVQDQDYPHRVGEGLS